MTEYRELDRAYRQAVYRLELPHGPLDLRIGEPSPHLRALLQSAGVSTAAFLTACNPASLPQDQAANQAAQASLLEAAARLGHTTLPGVALDPNGAWPAEESVLVLGISTTAAVTLARRFGQNALVWVDSEGTPELVWATDRPPA